MRINKHVLIVVIVSLIVIPVISILMLYWVSDDRMVFQGGRGYIKDNNELQWENGSFNNGYEGNYSFLYRAYVKIVLKSLKFDKTDDVIRDVQLVQFCFSSNGQTTYQLCLGYDFYQQKMYALADNEIYQVRETRLLINIITTQLDYGLNSISDSWRGQSTLAFEEFYNTDMSDPTFRYNLHWLPSKRPNEIDHEYRESGFLNVTPISIDSSFEAIQQAAKELGYQNPIGIALYDKTCGYWMVEILDDIGYIGNSPTEIQKMLMNKIYTVIMDEHGKTLETYRSVTRYLPFIEAICDKSS